MKSIHLCPMEELKFDVMSRGYYVCTMKMPIKKGRRLLVRQIAKYVREKHPTLKYETMTLCFDGFEIDISSDDV